MRALLLSLSLLPFAACRTRPAMPPETNRMQPEFAPTPFSAAQIRESCDDGRVSTFLVKRPMQPPMLQVFRFKKGTAEHAAFAIEMTGTDGKAMGVPRAATAPWAVLQSHASFPESETKITEDSVRTPAGRFDCWLYTVTAETEGKPVVMHYYFAKDLAGPPVRLVEETDGAETYSMTLVEHSRGR